MTAPTSEAIAAAKKAQAKWHIPASIQLAQWALESAWGHHMTGAFNSFGMKAKPGQPCEIVTTHECYKGVWTTIQAAFRSFANADEAFDAHAKLLATAACYAPARHALPNVFNFARKLTGVYATDPAYDAKLTAIIHGSQLTRYDS